MLFVLNAMAGELIVHTPERTVVLVDGQRTRGQMQQHHTGRLADGLHSITIQRGSRVLDEVWVDIPGDSRVLVEWAVGPQGPAFTVFRPEPLIIEPLRPARPVVVHPPADLPMEPGPFRSLLTQLRDASFDNGRTSILQTAMAHNFISSRQLREILATYSFDSHRSRAACNLAPNVVDPPNVTVISDAFTFDSHRDQALACFR